MSTPPRANARTRDPERTRGRLLDAAAEVFAQKGFEGTSLADLVAASGVNRRMVYHYFGDKRGLYRAVFEDQWRQLAVHVVAQARDSGDPLTHVLLGFFDFLREHRRFVRLMMWEGLEGGDISRAIWESSREPIFRSVEAVLREAQRAGRLDGRLDVGHLVASFMGAVTFYFAYAPTLEQVFGEDALKPARLARQRKQLALLLENLVRDAPR